MKSSLLLLLLAPSTALADPSFSPWSFTEKDLFSSAIVSTATVDWNGEEEAAEDAKEEDDDSQGGDVPIYGDENGWIGVELSELPEGSEVEVQMSVDGFMKPSKWKGTISKCDEDGMARVFPKAAWDFEALLKVRQQRPVTVNFKVSVDGSELPEQNETCVLKSINDCPFYVQLDEEGEEIEDFSWLFASYVNENHPVVDEILKEALKSGLVNSFTGYQSKDPDEVILQVFAIWNTLQRKGIKYSDISSTTPSKTVVSQSVRFIDDSIKATQANCVDGSVLMASILRKIGIEAYLVMVPGHCYLAFDTGKDDEADRYGLETTLLGNDNLKPVKEVPKLSETARKKEFEASYKTFTSAIESGTADLEKHADDFESEEDPNIQLISISEARKLGIMPIASGEGK
jgi:hypothetical protein